MSGSKELKIVIGKAITKATLKSFSETKLLKGRLKEKEKELAYVQEQYAELQKKYLELLNSITKE